MTNTATPQPLTGMYSGLEYHVHRPGCDRIAAAVGKGHEAVNVTAGTRAAAVRLLWAEAEPAESEIPVYTSLTAFTCPCVKDLPDS